MNTNLAFSSIKSDLRGFTLIELLTVLLIVIITMVSGMPSLINTLQEQKLTSQANDIIATLNLARAESVKRQQTVSIRKNTKWSNGWTVFVDLNSDGTKSGSDILIKTITGVGPDSLTISSNDFSSYLSYEPTGEANSPGVINLCPDSSIDSSRRITIEGSGRMMVSKGSYSDYCS